MALSSIEVGYRGVAVWLNRLLKDFNDVNKPKVIQCDNLTNIQLAKNPVFHAWTNHMEVHYHYIRDHILAGDIDL